MSNFVKKRVGFITILRNPIKNLKDFWRNQTPLQKFVLFTNYTWFIGGTMFKFRVFTKRSSNGFLGPFLFTVGVFSYILVFYTLFYYTYIGEFTNALPTFCVFGFMTSCYAALGNILTKGAKKWPTLLEMARKNILRDDNRPTAYNRICSEGVNSMIISYAIKIAVIQMSFILALVGPVNTYIQDGVFVTLYETRIPFLQDDPNTEFLINMTWQTFVNVCGLLGLLILEAMPSVANTTIITSAKLTVLRLNELSNDLETENIEMEKACEEVKTIIMQVIYMDKYINVYSDLWYWRLFLAPPTFLFSISISIYSQLKLGYPAGFGLAAMSYVQMAIICMTGQTVIDRNERLVKAFYDFKWYLLPTKQQKEIMFMIQHLQNREGLKMGPFETLNYETLKFLSKKVFSLFMFLKDFN